ncbi:CLUMA_CG016331, isoform A [Clunio marinus]|uniref:CLUMA_CG016331, isoform A n=1 Tax=Clunio marinus TaxID=568069 RepID=A0A1J1ISI8_9DIPT|nr:CLUMA_CG016331, isoform A [Clunio marinus]
MMKWIVVILVHSLLTPNLINVRGNTGMVHRRFEYKYSFKPPYLAQKDNTIPFWEYGGNVH